MVARRLRGMRRPSDHRLMKRHQRLDPLYSANTCLSQAGRKLAHQLGDT
jgi:hypothetical protein